MTLSNTFVKSLTLGLLLAGSMAYAKGERTDPDAKARAVVMQAVAANTKILGDMASGKTAFDAAAAEAAKAALVEASAKAPVAFKMQGAADPASEAKPEVWTNWEDFVKKANGLAAAATAIDASTLDGVKAGVGGVGGTCKDCHTTYRM
ncbi:MAG: cytochrome c [Pseudomonadota bacterium]